jgi:hypothetical protein
MTPKNEQRIGVTRYLDPRLFAAFALANVAGYNTENSWEFGRVRQAIRRRLAAHSNRWHTALEDAGALSCLQRGGGARLMDLVPQLSLPDFALARPLDLRVTWQAGSRSALPGLESILADFAREERISELWAEFTPEYEAAAKLFVPAQPSLQRLAGLWAGSSEVDPLEVLLLPNLLDAAGRGYSVSTAERTWLFFGPMRNPKQAEEVAVHELLHRWIDHACQEQWTQETSPDPMPAAKARFRIVAELYPEFQIWVSETIVRAATAWLVPDLEYVEERGTDKLLAYYERIGFIGVGAAYELLIATAGQPLMNVIDECISVVRMKVWEECI